MNNAMYTDPSLKAELDVLRQLESSNGRDTSPRKGQDSVGAYQLTPRALIDAVQNNVMVPETVKNMVGDYDKKTYGDKFATEQVLHEWMKRNEVSVDAVAEKYYEQVVRPRADNSAPAAIMMWQSPARTQQDLKDLGLTSKDVGKDPTAMRRFFDYVQGGDSLDRAIRADRLSALMPILDHSKQVVPPEPNPAPGASSQAPPGMLQQFLRRHNMGY